MPNIQTVLKSEISRLARKEVRDATDGLKKTVAAQRVEIAALKKRQHELEKLVAQVVKITARATPRTAAAADDAPAAESGRGLRFSAKGLASHRQRLELSAADFGLLVGATGQSIYGWESGKTQPSDKALAAIAAVRSMGKREVATRLVELKG